MQQIGNQISTFNASQNKQMLHKEILQKEKMQTACAKMCKTKNNPSTKQLLNGKL